jgi:AraC-like DNA-binding protein
MIYLVGITLTCFLILLLALKKNKTKPDIILLVWMALLMVHLLLVFVQNSSAAFDYPHLLGLQFPFPVLHGVLLFVYASELTGKSLLKRKRNLFLLSPFIVLTLLAFPFYILPGDEKIKVFMEEGKGFEWYMILQLGTIITSGLTFSVLTIGRIRVYRKSLFDLYSATHKKMLFWIEFLALGLALIWVVALFFDDPVIFGGVVIFVLLIGVFGINQVPVFYSELGNELLINPEKEAPSETEKYAKTGLKEEDASNLLRRLETLMQNEKPYLEPELTLNELANRLQCPSHQLSQVINAKCGKTFYHYINSYRIKEFLELSALPENNKFTLLALAYEAGFNSKTTFNKYFKLETGKNPSEYLD